MSTERLGDVPASRLAHAELYALRREALEADRRTRLFFLELDERSTSPDNGAAHQAGVLRLTYALFQRIEVRAHFGARQLVPSFRVGVAGEAGLSAPLGAISALFAELVERHFDGRLERVDWAFEQFTSGACAAFHRDPRKHRALQSCGAPDGSEFFKFGELALLALEQDVQRALWTGLLPTLVRCTHLFAELAAPPAPGEARMTGANEYAFRFGRPCRIEWRQARQALYDPLLALPELERVEILTQRYTSILAQAFTDTAVLGTDLVEEPARPLQHAVALERRFATGGA